MSRNDAAAAPDHPGIGEAAIDPAEIGKRSRESLVHRAPVGDVAQIGLRLAPMRAELRLRPPRSCPRWCPRSPAARPLRPARPPWPSPMPPLPPVTSTTLPVRSNMPPAIALSFLVECRSRPTCPSGKFCDDEAVSFCRAVRSRQPAARPSAGRVRRNPACAANWPARQGRASGSAAGREADGAHFAAARFRQAAQISGNSVTPWPFATIRPSVDRLDAPMVSSPCRPRACGRS